jgi:hypothetical protein
MRLLLLASRTGVRLPTPPLRGCPGFRLGVIGVTVDAGICLNANNIVKFERALVTA